MAKMRCAPCALTPSDDSRSSPHTDDCRNIEGPIGAEALYPHSFWCPDGFSSELWDTALEEMTR